MLSEREILKNAVFGPPYREGRERGLAEGEAKGEVKGDVKGQAKLILRLLEKRFGGVTPRLRKRLAAMGSEELTELGVRVLDVQHVEDLFAR